MGYSLFFGNFFFCLGRWFKKTTVTATAAEISRIAMEMPKAERLELAGGLDEALSWEGSSGREGALLSGRGSEGGREDSGKEEASCCDWGTYPSSRVAMMM